MSQVLSCGQSRRVRKVLSQGSYSWLEQNGYRPSRLKAAFNPLKASGVALRNAACRMPRRVTPRCPPARQHFLEQLYPANFPHFPATGPRKRRPRVCCEESGKEPLPWRLLACLAIAGDTASQSGQHSPGLLSKPPQTAGLLCGLVCAQPGVAGGGGLLHPSGGPRAHHLSLGLQGIRPRPEQASLLQ